MPTRSPAQSSRAPWVAPAGWRASIARQASARRVAASRPDYTSFDGRRILYAGPVEPAVTAVAVAPRSILINDPLLGVRWIDKTVFESAHATYNRMAVILD